MLFGSQENYGAVQDASYQSTMVVVNGDDDVQEEGSLLSHRESRSTRGTRRTAAMVAVLIYAVVLLNYLSSSSDSPGSLGLLSFMAPEAKAAKKAAKAEKKQAKKEKKLAKKEAKAAKYEAKYGNMTAEEIADVKAEKAAYWHNFGAEMKAKFKPPPMAPMAPATEGTPP